MTPQRATTGPSTAFDGPTQRLGLRANLSRFLLLVGVNALVGVNQGLTWSATMIMKIDLAGPDRRGLAMGLNEAAGYGAVAVTALATGWIAATAGAAAGAVPAGPGLRRSRARSVGVRGA